MTSSVKREELSWTAEKGIGKWKIDDWRVGQDTIICAPSIQYIEQMDEKPEDYSQEDDAGIDLIDFYVLPHYLTAPILKKVTEKIMTEFSDLNLCPINNRQGIVIDGEDSKVICKD